MHHLSPVDMRRPLGGRPRLNRCHISARPSGPTGASACPENSMASPVFPGRILLPDPDARLRAPNDQYFSRPLVAGTLLTVVDFSGGFSCVGPAFEATRTVVTKVPQR